MSPLFAIRLQPTIDRKGGDTALSLGLCFQNIAPYFAVPLILPRDTIRLDVTSASGPARSRRALPGAQRQRMASRHEA